MDAKELFHEMKALRQEHDRVEMIDRLRESLEEINSAVLKEVASVTLAGPDTIKERGLTEHEIASLVVMARFGCVLWAYRDVFLSDVVDFSDDTVLEGAS